MVNQYTGVIATILALLITGTAITDNPIKDLVIDFASDMLGVSEEMMKSFIEFMGYIFNILVYSFNLILGLLYSLVNAFGEAWILLISLIFLIIGVITFSLANLYTCFLVYEFFILALCIQEHRSPIHKITLLFEYQFMIIYVMIFIMGFLFKIPELFKNMFELFIDIIKFAWIILSDLAKIVADLIPFT